MIEVPLIVPIRGDNGRQILSVFVHSPSRRAFKRRPRSEPLEFFNFSLIAQLSLSEAAEISLPDFQAIMAAYEQLKTAELIASGHLARTQSGELIAGPSL